MEIELKLRKVAGVSVGTTGKPQWTGVGDPKDEERDRKGKYRKEGGVGWGQVELGEEMSGGSWEALGGQGATERISRSVEGRLGGEAAGVVSAPKTSRRSRLGCGEWIGKDVRI